MAIARMPEAFYELAAHHLPPERAVGPAGGRPPIDHRSIVKVLWFVLATGCRWEDVPPDLGCSGRTAHHFLQHGEEMSSWHRLHADRLRLLQQAGKLDPDLIICRCRHGAGLRRRGTDRPQPRGPEEKGSKHALLVDRHGVPLVVRTAGRC